MYYDEDSFRIRRNRSRSQSLSRDDSDSASSRHGQWEWRSTSKEIFDNGRRSPSPLPQPSQFGSRVMRSRSPILDWGEGRSTNLLRDGDAKDDRGDSQSHHFRSSSPVNGNIGGSQNPRQFNENLKHQELNTDSTIMIQGLARDLTEDDIRDELLKDGFVTKHVRLIRSRTVPGISRGVAFVEFRTGADAALWMTLKTDGKFQANFTDDQMIPEPLRGSDSQLVLMDWHCQNCKSPNFKLRENCFKCSAPREYREDLTLNDDQATVSRRPVRASPTLEKNSVAATAIAAARWTHTLPIDDDQPSQQTLIQNASNATKIDNCNRPLFGMSDIDERNKWKKMEEMEKVREAERIAKALQVKELERSSNANQEIKHEERKNNFENRAKGKDDDGSGDDEQEYLVQPLAPLPYHFLPLDKMPFNLMRFHCANR
ncbi:unnamed protein product [Orchesella dallaii]